MGAPGWAIQGLSGFSWHVWGRGSTQGLLLRPGILGGQPPNVGGCPGDCPHPPKPLPGTGHSGWRTGTPTLVTVTPCHHVPGLHLQRRVLGWSWAPHPFTPHAPLVHLPGMGPSPAMGSGRHPPHLVFRCCSQLRRQRGSQNQGPTCQAGLCPWRVQVPCRGGVCPTGQN